MSEINSGGTKRSSLSRMRSIRIKTSSSLRKPSTHTRGNMMSKGLKMRCRASRSTTKIRSGYSPKISKTRRGCIGRRKRDTISKTTRITKSPSLLLANSITLASNTIGSRLTKKQGAGLKRIERMLITSNILRYLEVTD